MCEVCRYPAWDAVDTHVFDWGYIKWITSKVNDGDSYPAMGLVTMLPGGGHERHNHPQSNELLFVISGSGEQMVELDDGTPDIRHVVPGDVVKIPMGVYHSTLNTGSSPMQVLALYSPSGAEQDLLAQPDLVILPGDVLPSFGLRQR